MSLFRRDMVDDSLVYPVSESTEAVIQRTIEGIQRMIKVHSSPQGEDKEEQSSSSVIKVNPSMKKHWKLKIKILQDSQEMQTS